jgi:hypothetical protein
MLQRFHTVHSMMSADGARLTFGNFGLYDRFAPHIGRYRRRLLPCFRRGDRKDRLWAATAMNPPRWRHGRKAGRR